MEEKILNLNEIKIGTIPFDRLNREWNAWLAGNWTEPKIKFNKEGTFSASGEYRPDSKAYGFIMNVLESKSNGEHE